MASTLKHKLKLGGRRSSSHSNVSSGTELTHLSSRSRGNRAGVPEVDSDESERLLWGGDDQSLDEDVLINNTAAPHTRIALLDEHDHEDGSFGSDDDEHELGRNEHLELGRNEHLELGRNEHLEQRRNEHSTVENNSSATQQHNEPFSTTQSSPPKEDSKQSRDIGPRRDNVQMHAAVSLSAESTPSSAALLPSYSQVSPDLVELHHDSHAPEHFSGLPPPPQDRQHESGEVEQHPTPPPRHLHSQQQQQQQPYVHLHSQQQQTPPPRHLHSQQQQQQPYVHLHSQQQQQQPYVHESISCTQRETERSNAQLANSGWSDEEEPQAGDSDRTPNDSMQERQHRRRGPYTPEHLRREVPPSTPSVLKHNRQRRDSPPPRREELRRHVSWSDLDHGSELAQVHLVETFAPEVYNRPEAVAARRRRRRLHPCSQNPTGAFLAGGLLLL
eukprot:CAMPEP_0174246580 /NCGR_PEP_ID=MMETSP0417-20130205/42143_1 /TAXON_ID=242541 /ORGANISM="Mayorella sp, Strain BSH-02190019" /LENGTH=443 /DNA_ID=CAMNT_0015326433 /DNA_START=134 /DNA_END=1462 /DNA_ORIENTATION=-